MIYHHWECTSSPGMGMCLTGDAYPHQEWECALPGMHILTENGDVLTGNAHSLYSVNTIRPKTVASPNQKLWSPEAFENGSFVCDRRFIRRRVSMTIKTFCYSQLDCWSHIFSERRILIYSWHSSKHCKVQCCGV